MLKLPEHWKDRILESRKIDRTRQKTKRALMTPSDSSVLKDIQLKIEAAKRSPWFCAQRNLRLLNLSRDPLLSTSQIAEILNKEFSTLIYTKGSIIGRLRELRDVENGVRRKRYRVAKGVY